MCVCTPNIRTPWCGKPGCEMPEQIRRKEQGRCPDCGDPWETPERAMRCTLNQPWMISIPAGQHIHIPCPVHGSHRLNGPSLTF